MLHKKLTYIIFPLLFTSCALFRPTPVDRTYVFISGRGIKSDTTSEEIINHIGRSMNMSGGNYTVKAYPITRELLKAQTLELARQRGLSDEEIQKIELNHEQEFLLRKTCFNVSYAALNHVANANLIDWKIHFIDANNDEYPMLWRAEDLKRMPVVTKVQRQEGNLDQYLNQGIICTDNQFNLEKGFGLKVTPKFVQWPFPATENLLWEFDYIEVNDKGEEVEVKKTKQNYQPYRGW